MSVTATAEELLAVVRELFPREYDIAALTLLTRKQARHIAGLEQQVAELGASSDDHG